MTRPSNLRLLLALALDGAAYAFDPRGRYKRSLLNLDSVPRLARARRRVARRIRAWAEKARTP
jgi:hypothetical protein